MSASVRPALPPSPPHKSQRTEALDVTLLELVTAVNDVADNEREVIATVLHMLASGRVRLSGTFRGQRLLPS